MALEFSNYGQEREIDATPEEYEIFEIIRSISDKVRLVRRTDKYVSASIGDTDVARFKYTSRAKWIQFPYTAGKIKIASVSGVSGLENEIRDAVNEAEKIESN